jgi:rubrerythrin
MATIISGVPQVVWFVRRIADDETPARVIYGVCGRNDDELKFDSGLQCAPPLIESLCRENTPGSTGANAEKQWLGPREAVEKMVVSVARVTESESQALDFKNVLLGEISSATRGRKLRAILRKLQEKYGDGEKLFSEKGIVAGKTDMAREPEARMPATTVATGNAHRTRKKHEFLAIDADVLERVLGKSEAVFMIRDDIMRGKPVDFLLLSRLKEGVYVCRECGAINMPDENPKASPRPKQCVACRAPFQAGDAPEEAPANITSCRSCGATFERREPKSGWKNRKRRDGQCPYCASARLK